MIRRPTLAAGLALVLGLVLLVALTALPASAQQDLSGIDPTGQTFTVHPGEGFESIGIGGGVSVTVDASSGAGLVLGVNVTGVDYAFVCSDLDRQSTGSVVTIGCDGDDITDSPGVMPVGLGCMAPPCTMSLESLSGYPFAFIAGNLLGAETVTATVTDYTPWTAPESTTTTAPTTTTTAPPPPPVELTADERNPIGSLDALQWLALLAAFVLGHVAIR